MAEVKLIYYPLVCKALNGALCKNCSKDYCQMFTLQDEDDDGWDISESHACIYADWQDNPSVISKSVKSFEFSGLNPFMNFDLQIGNKHFNGINCKIENLIVDQKTLIQDGYAAKEIE